MGTGLPQLLSASPQPAQEAGAPGAVSRIAKTELEAWRSGVGSEGTQNSPGYLPEVLTVVADTAGTACPPSIQPGQPHEPRVQLIAHSWAETASVGSQHLWAPTVSEPTGGEVRWWERAVRRATPSSEGTPPVPHYLRSCRRQSPGPPAFQNGLAAVTIRAPPAAHSPQHRAPGQGDRCGWEGWSPLVAGRSLPPGLLS